MQARQFKKRLKIIGALILIGFVLLNAVAFMHAYRFTHVVAEVRGTRPPEELSAPEKLKVLVAGVTVAKIGNKKTPRDFGYAFADASVESDLGGRRLRTPVWEVKAAESKRTVLMFHAYHSRKEHLLPLADFLLRQDCDVVLADLPGHGDSSENWSTLGYREADIVRDVFEHYRAQKSKPLVFYGQSLGAAAILRAVSVHRIQPDGLVLEAPYGSLLETVRRRFDLMGFPFSFPFAELVVFWGGAQHGFNAFQLNPVEYAKDVTAPTLLLGGQQDYRVSRETLNRIHANLGGNKRLHVFKNSGHQSLFAADPQRYEQLVLEFLRDCTEK